MESTIIGLTDRSLELFISEDNLDRLVRDWDVWKERGVIGSVVDAVMGQVYALAVLSLALERATTCIALHGSVPDALILRAAWGTNREFLACTTNLSFVGGG